MENWLKEASFGGLVEVGVLGEVGQTEGGDETKDGGRCQAEVQGCSHLEVVVFPTFPELVGEAALSVVVNCSIAEVKAAKADTGCLGEFEVDEVLFACADGQAGPLPEERRQVDGGGDDNGQTSDEERGEGGHQVGVRLPVISNDTRDKGRRCIFLLNFDIFASH